jgi:hypothetical protein
VAEFLPRWEQNPPRHFKRWGIAATQDNITAELQKLAQKLFQKATTFEPPVVKTLYKNVAPENVRDQRFLGPLKEIMVTKHVPRAIIDSLFETGGAAHESGAFIT